MSIVYLDGIPVGLSGDDYHGPTHFQEGTAEAYNKGEYQDIPNDELSILYRGLIECIIGLNGKDTSAALSKLESVDKEIARRIKAAGIELV